MKGLRLGREKTGSSVGKKPKKSDKLIKQKNKAEKAANADSNEAALASPHFVDSKCDVYEKDSLFYLNKRLLGCGLTFFLSSCPHVELLDKPVENNIWGLISTVPPRRANMLSEEEHEELLRSVEGKPSVSAILTGVHYGKPPHGETKPCCSAAEQKVAFQVHCKVALAFKLPLVITMEASKDLHETAVGDVQAWLAECCIPEEYKLYFASWSGTSVSATKLLKRYKNCMLGLNGSLLFRANEHLREVAFDLPLTRLVLESDAPNNAPSESVLPHSSWTVLAVAQAVASQKKCNDVTLVLAETNKNAASFFNATLWKEEEEVEAGGGEKEGGGRVGEADLNLKEMAEYLEEVEGGDEED